MFREQFPSFHHDTPWFFVFNLNSRTAVELEKLLQFNSEGVVNYSPNGFHAFANH